MIYTKQNDDEDIVSKLLVITNKIYKDYYKKPKPLKHPKKEQEDFDKAESCHMCNKELCVPGKTLKVRDHCHFTGKYREEAHKSCNPQCRKPMILLVIFHNLQGFDSRLFIKKLAKLFFQLNCIPSTEEKYISFSKKIKVDEYKSRMVKQFHSILKFDSLTRSSFFKHLWLIFG